MKSILLIYNEIPINPDFGGNIRVHYMIKELSKYYKVTLLTLLDNKNLEDIINLKNYCDIVIAPNFTRNFNKKLFSLKSFIETKYLKYQRTYSQFTSQIEKNHSNQIYWLKKELINLLKRRKFDYIQVEHSYLGNVIKNVKTNAIKIINFHNVHSFMNYSIKEKKLIKKHEKTLKKKFDISLCCSKKDKIRLIKLGMKKIIIVPNGVDTKYFKFYKSNKNKKSLLFIGTLNYKPNLIGIKYFINEIYPILHSKIKLNIIGKFNNKNIINEINLKNVNFIGFVKDIRPYLENAIFICPLLDGGGTRIKILTAFSSGVPVISTPKGAEGINYQNNKDIYIANTPQIFAKKIDNLTSNQKKYNQTTNNARKLVKSIYNWEFIIKNYNKCLEEIRNES